MWTVKALLKRTDVDTYYRGSDTNAVEWLPVDPEVPTYDSYHSAMSAANDYREKHPHARIETERARSDMD